MVTPREKRTIIPRSELLKTQIGGVFDAIGLDRDDYQEEIDIVSKRLGEMLPVLKIKEGSDDEDVLLSIVLSFILDELAEKGILEVDVDLFKPKIQYLKTALQKIKDKLNHTKHIFRTEAFNTELESFDIIFVDELDRIVARYGASEDEGKDKSGVDSEEVPDWEFRPEDRRSWMPDDYVNYIWAERSNPASSIELPGGGLLRTEYNRFVEAHPKLKGRKKYWETVVTTATVLWQANPSASNGFTVDVGAYHTKKLQEGGWDTENVADILGDQEYGRTALKVLALIEMCLYDHGIGKEHLNFEYVAQQNQYKNEEEEEKASRGEPAKTTFKRGEKIVGKGEFVARAMDGNQKKLSLAVQTIVKELGWLDVHKQDTDATKYLVDRLVGHAFDISNATDSRGHFFLNDSASAVTNGFSGTDVAWECAPGNVIGYKKNRYDTEPQASYYFLSVLGFPKEWHLQAAKNTFFRSDGELVLGDDTYKFTKSSFDKYSSAFTNVQKTAIEDFIIYYENENFADEYHHDASKIKSKEAVKKLLKNSGAFKKLAELLGAIMVRGGEKEEHEIQHWFHELLSEKDVNACLAESNKNKYLKREYSVPFKKEKRKKHHGQEKKEAYVFNPQGATFPTVYQYYIGQLMDKKSQLKFSSGRIVSHGLTTDMLLDNDTLDKYIKRNTKLTDRFVLSDVDEDKDLKIQPWQMYMVARSGWVKAIDTLKLKPTKVDSDSLLRGFDDFLGNLGKAKIIPGAHHNMMNVLSLLYLTKMFKWLEPRDYNEFRRTRKLALNKVSGGGIPPQVKTYLTWLLDEATSLSRGGDDKGDLLRPMDPSTKELREEAQHHETRGMDEGWRKSLAKLQASAGSFLGDINHETVDEGQKNLIPLPLGHIKWDKQDTSTTDKK